MRFDFVTNSRIERIKSLNSKNAHFNLFACENMHISQVELTAPGDSPNTDGIHIGDCANITITDSVIGTGDDCISMISTTQNVDISNVSCGPGHGISIGSLGKSNDEYVHNISVTSCNISDTQNGLRIKTWAPSMSGKASSFLFQDISMNNVQNPIIIDQKYCPVPPCDDQVIISINQALNVFSKIILIFKIVVKFMCDFVVGSIECSNQRRDV